MKLINKRHSVRKFIPTPIPNDFIEKSIELARKAPSAGGLRAYRIYWTKENDRIKNLAIYARQGWIANASLIFIICVDPKRSARKYGERGKVLYCIQDATLFCAYLDLLMVEAGYGTCWVGAIKTREVMSVMRIKNEFRPLNYLVVGAKA